MKKIVIIGAGPAGLTCAYDLLKKGEKDVTILEASSTIGGISRTFNFHGNRMDLGGHRFFSKDQEVMDLWNEIMPLQGSKSKDDIMLNRDRKIAEIGPDPEKEDDVMLVRTRVSRIFFLRKFFDYPISMKPRTFINMGFRRTMKAGFGYLGTKIHKRKENSLEDFYINRFGKPLYQMFFEDYTTKVWGLHPSKISPDWGSQRVKGLSLSKAIFSALGKPFRKLTHSNKVETSLIEEFYYPKYGPGHLYETMAQKVIDMGGKILFNHPVTKINYEDRKIISVETEFDGVKETFQADYFVSSMAIKDLYLALDKEKVPTDVYDIAINLPYRDFITVGLLLPKLKIENKTKMKTVSNIVPDCWIYIQERDVKVGRLQIFNNWSPYMVKDLENTIFIGLEYFANEGDELWNMDDEEFISFAEDELQKIDIIDKKDVIDACRLKVKKAYPAYFGVYKDFNKVQHHLKSISNLLCVGRNGQHRYNNMDHSMASSLIASSIIREEHKFTMEDLWNVNTEKSYHEISKGQTNKKNQNKDVIIESSNQKKNIRIKCSKNEDE